MVDRIGQQLGNYYVIRLIGKGGFSEVYLGEHIYLRTQVAIKLLNTQLISDDIEGFLTEARTIAHLIHPHIVRVMDFGIDGETPFLVMDYAQNGTLRHRHPKGAILPPATVLDYVKQIAPALQYAHDHKLIHRDIKPENILLGRDNEILLSDFGIALIAQSSHYQSTQDVVGTVAYMSPEQIQGKPRPASDQYSLGIVVYEWLSGARPFHGSFTELCTQHMFASPPSLREKVPSISPDVEQVITTALAKDPKQRFGSMQAFVTALEQAFQPITPLPSNVIPSGELSLPTNEVVTILPNQTLQSTNMIVPTYPPTILSPSTKDAISSGKPQPSKSRLFQRIVLPLLAGLLILGGGFSWLILSHLSTKSIVNLVPSATFTPLPTPTATLSLTPTATATPSPTPTATATPSPSPSPTPTATATPS